jgi:predicted HTH transcriptional regulator
MHHFMRHEVSEHIRNAILYCFERRLSTQAAYDELKSTFGHQAPSLSTVERYFNRFRTEGTDIKDKPRAGRSMEFTTEMEDAMIEEVEADGKITTRMLAEMFGVTNNTIFHHLMKRGMVMWLFTFYC